MIPSESEIRGFQRKIFSWWNINRRDLPWRRTSDPYRILVSEIMLQQTQVSRVLPKYEEFVRSFPDVTALADASSTQVIIAWKGLGYYRRALYLQRIAQAVQSEHDGTFPESEEQLLRLPGIGLYTARAVRVFSFRHNVAMVDTNIRKIITHYFFRDTAQSPAAIQSVADALVPEGRSWEWHQALMDFGALALKAELPKMKKNKGKSVPFRQTARFIRGKIIDMLRSRAYGKTALVSELSAAYARSPEDINKEIGRLTDESLIVQRTSGIVSLPE